MYSNYSFIDILVLVKKHLPGSRIDVNLKAPSKKKQLTKWDELIVRAGENYYLMYDDRLLKADEYQICQTPAALKISEYNI